MVAVAPLHGAMGAQGCVFYMTVESLAHSRLLCASKAVSKTPDCPAVYEARTGRLKIWKRLA